MSTPRLPVLSGSGSLGLQSLLAQLWRRRWLASALFATGVAVTAALAVALPDTYEASALLLVERQQVPTELVRSTVGGELDRRLNVISQTIMGRSNLLALVEKHGLYKKLRQQFPMEVVVAWMRSDIKVELRAGSRKRSETTTSFAVSYRGQDPHAVAAVANELAGMYITEDLKIRERQATGTTSFLERQLEQELKRQLEEQERALREFKEKHIGQLPQQQAANLAALERLNGQLLQNSERQAQLRELREALRRQRATAGGTASGGAESLEAHLFKRKLELEELRKRFTDKYPDVIQLKAEIENLERRLAEPAASVSGDARAAVPLVDPEVRKADAELAGLRAEEQALKRAMKQYQGRVEDAPKREEEYLALNRDYETTSEVYQSLLKRYEEARLAERMEQSQKGEQFRVLDPAIVPERPSAPNRLALAVVGVLVALAAAGASVLISEAFDSSFHSIDDFREAMRVPVVMTLCQVVTPEDRRRSFVKSVALATSTAAIVLVVSVGCYFLAKDNTWLVGLLF